MRETMRVPPLGEIASLDAVRAEEDVVDLAVFIFELGPIAVRCVTEPLGTRHRRTL
jgi:hypothetical protein